MANKDTGDTVSDRKLKELFMKIIETDTRLKAGDGLLRALE